MLSNPPRESETEAMTALPKEKYTLEEYLELDRKSEERLEFWNGEIFSLSEIYKNVNLLSPTPAGLV
jgi:hypothetical protein